MSLPAMYLGVGATAWIAWTAIGTLALALVTVVAVLVTVGQAAKERQRDDARRAEDRAHDDHRRAEDREREDQLRREAAAERGRRDAAGRREREDNEARQVVVMVVPADVSAKYPEFVLRVDVITPHAYPVKVVEAQYASWVNANLSMRPFGFRPNDPDVGAQRVVCGFLAPRPRDDRESPIVRFVDRRGTRYYQWQHYTIRADQNTGWIEAAQQTHEWLGRGPDPG